MKWKNVPVGTDSKKGHVDNILRLKKKKRLVTIDFLEKNTTINRASSTKVHFIY